MGVELFKTTLAVGQDGNTAPGDVDPFRNTLNAISDPAGVIDVQPLVQDANALTEVKAGTINFALMSATAALGGSVADHLTFTHEFGMELQEMLSWWYEGGGEALFNGLLVAEDLIQFPMVMRASESGGWFREAITLDKLLAGKYANGDTIKYRAFGTHADAMIRAFPNVDTIETGAGLTDLAAIQAGTFNAGEFNEPYGDASPTDPSIGLFPSWPAKTGSIVEALGGRPHYYVGSYHTPFRCRALLVNRTWFLAQSAADQTRIEAAARHCLIRNMAHSMQGGDAIIQAWKDMGVVVHGELPANILDQFRNALQDAQDELADTDANYKTVLDHQRAFMRANGVRWSTLPGRKYRSARTDYNPDLRVL